MNRVKDFIYRDILSVNEHSDLRRVIITMKRHRICAIPVVNQLGEYVGCISEQDILNASVPHYMKSMYNTFFMADLDHIVGHLHDLLDEEAIKFTDSSYPTVTPNDSMSYAADLLFRSKKAALPVLEGKLLIGLITRIEILTVSLNGNKLS
ncbi:membrane protein [Prolixibacter sp. SD074]|nr:membrane protein [Prolixibacter sp. SD074]